MLSPVFGFAVVSLLEVEADVEVLAALELPAFELELALELELAFELLFFELESGFEDSLGFELESDFDELSAAFTVKFADTVPFANSMDTLCLPALSVSRHSPESVTCVPPFSAAE